MSAVQLDAGQHVALTALDSALDTLFTSGGENPPGTQIVAPMPGYAQSAHVNRQDLRPQVRKVFETVLMGLSAGTPPWIAPTLLNSWANYGSGFNNAGYYKDILGIVHLRGLIQGGTGGSVVFNLPAGYRPPGAGIYTVWGNQATVNTMTRIDVLANGNVSVLFPVGGTFDYLSLEQVIFRAV